MVCADVSPFAGVEKCPDFRGTGTPAAIPLDVSSELASISEKIRERKLLRNWIISNWIIPPLQNLFTRVSYLYRAYPFRNELVR